MPAPRKFSDTDLKFHWDQTGNIRETARRLGIQYSAVHERLLRGNFIQSPTFSPDRGEHTPRTIPEAVTLVIPDIQAPAQHPDALAFLCAIRDKYKPVNVASLPAATLRNDVTRSRNGGD